MSCSRHPDGDGPDWCMDCHPERYEGQPPRRPPSPPVAVGGGNGDGFSDQMTLGEARALLRTLVEDGYHCPCCTQFAKVYRRTIHASMAATLIRIWRSARHPGEWIYLPNVPQKSRDATGMAWWGLIEEELERREDGGRAGWWRVTELGARWVHDAVRVPKYAHVYDGRCLRLTGEPLGVRAALGHKFDYRELMDG